MNDPNKSNDAGASTPSHEGGQDDNHPARERSAELSADAEERQDDEQRAVFNQALDAFLIADDEGRCVEVNRAACELLGYSRDELLRLRIEALVPPPRRARCRELWRMLIATGQQSGELTLHHRDGTALEVEYRAVAHILPGRHLSVIRDISERKQAERARDILSNLPDHLLCVTGTDGYFKQVNAAWEAMLGFSREELMATPLTELIHLEDRAHTAAVLVDLSQGSSHRSFQSRFLCRDGSYRWLLCSATFVPTERLIYVLAHDISEQKLTEAALRSSEARFRALVNSMDDLVFTLDTELRHVEVYGRWLEKHGYSADYFLGRTVREVFGPEKAGIHESACGLALKGESTTYEWEMAFPTEMRRFQTSLSPLLDGVGRITGIVSVGRDLTEQRQLEAQFMQAQKMEAIGRLAGGVAHDFNNLLTAINGYNSLVLRKLHREDPLRGYLEEVRNAGDRAAALTSQLLAFSRKQILQPHILNLNQIIADLEKMLRRLIGEDIELQTALQDGLGSVKVDPGQAEQVIMNLAVNARDAMPQGGRLMIETKNIYLDEEYVSRHLSASTGPHVMLAVSDTGIGMDEETRRRIFEPFFTTKEKGKGTGLGLSTVYGIVRQSGGSIWVYSEVGKGTTFKIYLPKVDEGAEDYHLSAESEDSPGGTETILLAEDDESVRSLVRTVLTAKGYCLLDAASGAEAMLACEHHAGPIHLLITDVVMPEMSGGDLARRAARLRPAMKVLFMSGYTENTVVHHGVLDEGIEFIAKPFSTDALARKVREVLDQPLGEGGS